MSFTGHDSPTAMVKALVPYISNPKRIRSEVLATFDNAPCEASIRGHRAAWLRAKNAKGPDLERGVLVKDEKYREAMEQASKALRSRIETALAERNQREAERRRINEAARYDIRLGKQKGWIMREHGLSETAYEQLAGQVRAGWTI